MSWWRRWPQGIGEKEANPDKKPEKNEHLASRQRALGEAHNVEMSTSKIGCVDFHSVEDSSGKVAIDKEDKTEHEARGKNRG